MKAVILAGGLGTRLSEETAVRPKPMVEVGGRPILWHIMKIYSAHGINEFIICLGYRGDVIRRYISEYFLNHADVVYDFRDGSHSIVSSSAECWKVTLVDTGFATQTGGRIKRVMPYLAAEPAFCLTYGDGVADVNIRASIDLHVREGRLATVTGAQPPGRFGIMRTEDKRVTSFREKPDDDAWINGGFFVLDPRVSEYIEGDSTVWEREPLERLAADGQLTVHHHDGFRQPMDTLRDKQVLEQLWAGGHAPWWVW